MAHPGPGGSRPAGACIQGRPWRNGSSLADPAPGAAYPLAVGTLLSIVLVGVSVGLSNFAGALGIGLSGGVSARSRIRVAVAFGLFETVMPIIGLLVGGEVAHFVTGWSRYLGGGLLVLTGAYTIWEGRREQQETARGDMAVHRLALTALVLSIDNLVVGFALGVFHVPIVLAALVIGVVSVALSLAGLELGSRAGKRLEAWSEELSGAVLIGLGLALALGILS